MSHALDQWLLPPKPVTSGQPITSAPAGSNLTGYYSNWDPAHGGVPSVPNPAATQAAAVSANAAALPGLAQIAAMVNAFTQNQLMQMLRSSIPNYAALSQKQSGVIGSELSGEVPQDVVSQIIQRGAERGILTGAPGSPNSSAAYLRALGLNSLGMMGQGVKDFSTQIAETPLGQPFDFTKLFVTPEQEQQAAMAANLYASAPVPSAAAAALNPVVSSGPRFVAPSW